MPKSPQTSKLVLRESAWVVPFYPPNKTILIAKRSGTVNNPKLWNLFGGNFDRGDSAIKTARKEFREEAGIKIPAEALKFLGKSKTASKDGRFYMHFFMFEANHEFRPVLNEENTQSKWVHLEEIEDGMHSAHAHRSLRNFKQFTGNILGDKKDKPKGKDNKDDKGKDQKPKDKSKDK